MAALSVQRRQGRQEELEALRLGLVLQRLAQLAVGRHPAADHQAGAARLWSRASPARLVRLSTTAAWKLAARSRRAVSSARISGCCFSWCSHRGLEAGKGEGEGLCR